jgi:uncharacterized protein YjbJ (UPF0337 family)
MVKAHLTSAQAELDRLTKNLEQLENNRSLNLKLSGGFNFRSNKQRSHWKVGALNYPERRRKIRGSTTEEYKEHKMNKDIIEGKYKEMHGQMKEWWGKLTDDELQQAGGNAEQIVGLLQQKYGYTREAAEEEFNRRIKDVEKKVDKA